MGARKADGKENDVNRLHEAGTVAPNPSVAFFEFLYSNVVKYGKFYFRRFKKCLREVIFQVFLL
jgi:hypothetical protein